MPVSEQKESTTSTLDRVVVPSTLLKSSSPSAAAVSADTTNHTSATEDLELGAKSSMIETETETEAEAETETETETESEEVSSPGSDDCSVDVELMTSQVLEESNSKSVEENMIFFDWDDTLLCSTFLASHGYRLDTDMESKENFSFIYNELRQLEACVVAVLNEALPRGRVHIVTNAEHGWVELSAQKFIPAVLPYLSKVTVISARSTYEQLYPENPIKWKFSAFHAHLHELIASEQVKKNVLSFGDSHVEREAIRTVTRNASNTLTKSIKFTECPNADQLRKQLELVTGNFHYIYSHDGDLDLMLKMSNVQ